MKHINAILLTVACSVIFSLMHHAFGADGISDTEMQEAWQNLERSMTEKGRGSFPEVAKFIEETNLGSHYQKWALLWVIHRDGWDILTPGEPELLAATREVLPRLLDYDKRHESDIIRHGLVYLAQKGDVRDFPLYEKHLTDPAFWQLIAKRPVPLSEEKQERVALWEAMPYRILQHRVAGTNIVQGAFDWGLYSHFSPLTVPSYSYSTNWLHFIPSVANTGPQAAYVYAAMEQAIYKTWAQNTVKRTEGEEIERNGSNDDSPYGILTDNAPELLAMRVWFDEEGKAVCDVDLVKYGIFVPGLRMAGSRVPASPPQELQPSSAAADISVADAIEPATAPPFRSRLTIPLAFGMGVLTAFGMLAALRKNRRQ